MLWIKGAHLSPATSVGASKTEPGVDEDGNESCFRSSSNCVLHGVNDKRRRPVFIHRSVLAESYVKVYVCRGCSVVNLVFCYRVSWTGVFAFNNSARTASQSDLADDTRKEGSLRPQKRRIGAVRAMREQGHGNGRGRERHLHRMKA